MQSVKSMLAEIKKFLKETIGDFWLTMVWLFIAEYDTKLWADKVLCVLGTFLLFAGGYSLYLRGQDSPKFAEFFPAQGAIPLGIVCTLLGISVWPKQAMRQRYRVGSRFGALFAAGFLLVTLSQPNANAMMSQAITKVTAYDVKLNPTTIDHVQQTFDVRGRRNKKGIPYFVRSNLVRSENVAPYISAEVLTSKHQHPTPQELEQGVLDSGKLGWNSPSPFPLSGDARTNAEKAEVLARVYSLLSHAPKYGVKFPDSVWAGFYNELHIALVELCGGSNTKAICLADGSEPSFEFLPENGTILKNGMTYVYVYRPQDGNADLYPIGSPNDAKRLFILKNGGYFENGVP